MSDVRYGDTVWVKPPAGRRCVLPPAGGRRKIEVPPGGIGVTVDLMVLKLVSHGDLIVVAAPGAKSAAVKGGE